MVEFPAVVVVFAQGTVSNLLDGTQNAEIVKGRALPELLARGWVIDGMGATSEGTHFVLRHKVHQPVTSTGASTWGGGG